MHRARPSRANDSRARGGRCGCGLAWKALPADEELLRAELAAAGIPTEGYTVIDMWEVVR